MIYEFYIKSFVLDIFSFYIYLSVLYNHTLCLYILICGMKGDIGRILGPKFKI